MGVCQSKPPLSRRASPQIFPTTDPDSKPASFKAVPQDSPKGTGEFPLTQRMNSGLETVTAARMIQARWRTTIRRVEAERAVFWAAWNELDRMEEREMLSQHKYYVQLREKYAAMIRRVDAGEIEMSGLLDSNASGDEMQAKQEMKVVDRIPIRLQRMGERLMQVKVAQFQQKLPDKHILSSDDLFAVRQESCSTLIGKTTGEKYTVGDTALPLADGDRLTLAFVVDMIDIAKRGDIFPYEIAYQVLLRVWPLLANSRNCEFAEIPKDKRFTIVGDLHGQLWDLLTIFRINGIPSQDKPYVFNGDFVDRGKNSCEVVLLIMAFKVLYPDCVYMNRGNHEASDICRLDGFEKEVADKYDLSLFGLFCDVFACLPLALIIQNQVFVCHGGLAGRDFTIAELQELDRFKVVASFEDGDIMRDMMWSDPGRIVGRQPSKRGAGVVFGSDVVKSFLKSEKLRYIVRSHECVDGFQQFFGGRLLTVFSASNYCGDTGNRGGFITIGDDGSPMVELYMAKLFSRKKIDSLLENNVMGKLIIRIANNREALEDHWKEKTDSLLISRLTWSEGLRQVLDLDMPFILLAVRMGLSPDIAEKPGYQINYANFLKLFRPTSLQLQASAKDELKFKVSELLFQRKFELEALFRHFDADGSGTISKKEMVNGIISLLGVLGKSFPETTIKEMCADIDLDGQGGIDYDEFFQGFALSGIRMNVDDDEEEIPQQRLGDDIVRQSATPANMKKVRTLSMQVSSTTLQRERRREESAAARRRMTNDGEEEEEDDKAKLLLGSEQPPED